MTEIAELMLVVDSRPAEAGARRTQTALESVGKSATSLSRSLVGTFGSGGASPVQKGIDSIGASATRATPILAGLNRQILGLAGGLGAAKVFSDFARTTGTLDQNVRKIAQIQGLDRTADSLERIRGGLRDVGSGFFSQADTAASVREAAAANFTLAESFEVAASSEGLARDAALDYAKATGLVASATKALGLGASESARVASILARIGDLDPEGIANYVGVIQKIGPEARKATIGPAELGAALQVLDDEGQNATATGRDLTGIINAMVSPSKDAAAALREIGLTTADIDPRARTLGQIFEHLADVQLDAARAGKIFGDGNSATAIALARSAGKVSALEDELSKLLGLTADKRPRDLVEAIAAIGNAYEDLLVSAARAGAADAIVKGLAVLREIIDDLSGKDQEISGLAQSIEATGVAIGSAFLAPRIVNTLRAIPGWIVAIGRAAAANPFAALALGATAAIPAVNELFKKLEELRNGGTGGPNRDIVSFNAPIDAIRRTGFIANSPAAALGADAKAQLAEVEKLAESALGSGNVISQRAGVAAAGASKAFADRVLKALDSLRADGSAAANVAATDIANAFARPLLESEAFDKTTAERFQKALEGIGQSVTSAAPAEAAANQSRIAEALRATTEAAEREAAQMEALNEALRLENAVGVERSFLGISEQARAVAEQVETYRQTLIAAGVTSDEAAARLSTYANGVQQLADAQAAATRSTEDFAAAQAALAAVEGAVASLEFERQTVGKTAEEVARLRQELEFTQLANEAFGEGSAAAGQAIEEYGKDLADLQAAQKTAADAERERAEAAKRASEVQREAAEANRRAIQEQQRAAEDLARAFTGPVQSSIDSYVEALLKGEKASINFRDIAAEIGAGVFRETVTKPLTEKATAGLAGVFGGLFGGGASSQSSPAGVPGQAGAGALDAAGGVLAAAQVLNVQAAVVNVTGGLPAGVPGAGGSTVGAGVQGLAGLASAFGGGNSPAGVPDSGTGGTGSSLLGLSSLAATSGTGGGTTSTASQAQASVQPTTQPDPSKAAIGTALGAGATGAQIGTAVAPGIGTGIGFVIGAVLGYAAGYYGTSSRHGNVFNRGRLVPHRLGGIVDEFSAFPLAGGRVGTVAEDGPEAILPLRRGRGGRLGVDVSGAGGGGGRSGSRGGDITVNQTIYARDANSFRKSGAHIAADQRRAETRARARRN